MDCCIRMSLRSTVAPLRFRIGLSGIIHFRNRVKPQIRSCDYVSSRISPAEGFLGKFEKTKRKYCSIYIKTCWKCGNSLNDKELFCNGCNSIQKADSRRNYFELFGLNENYEIDIQLLRVAFRNLQRLLHPDLFNTKSEEEKNISEEYSSLVNKAYSTLLHPINRGLYMLKQKGVEIEEGTESMNRDFLLDIMERNEEVEGLRDKVKIKHLSQDYENIMRSLSNEAGCAFSEGDLENAKEIVIKMKYFSNLEMKLKVLKQRFDIQE